ncbi:MAG: nicotinate (nicotinamide) nucleotide adenylyltransferase [Thermodesulfobacteriota bacterium]
MAGAQPGAGQRLGILGGTFDPVHQGHLHVARAAQTALSLDAVWLIPAAGPPHKPSQPRAPFADRLAMLELAVTGEPGLVACGIEAERPSPSYTIDLLAALRGRLGPGPELFFLLGADAFVEIGSWKAYALLPAQAHLVVFPRPPVAPQEVEAAIAAVFPAFRRRSGESVWTAAGVPGRIRLLAGPPLAVSSSQVRQRISAGLPVSDLLPAAVAAHIVAHGLYLAHPALTLPPASGYGTGRPAGGDDEP